MLGGQESPKPPVHNPDAAGVLPMVVPARVDTCLDFVVHVNLPCKQLFDVQGQVLRNIVWRPRKHDFLQSRNILDYVADETALDVSHVVSVGFLSDGQAWYIC